MRAFINYQSDYNANVIERARNRDANPLSTNDVKLLTAFIEHKKDLDGKSPIKPSTEKNLVSRLCIVRANLSKDFDKATITDLKGALKLLRTTTKSVNSQNAFVAQIKNFYHFLIDVKRTKIKPSDLSKIYKQEVESSLTPDQLLTETEIQQMIDASQNAMHRALIAVTADSGGRISEVCGMKWKDITSAKFGDKPGYKWTLQSTKTGIRYVVLLDSEPYLKAWQITTPHKSPEDFVFVTRGGERLIYETARVTIARIAASAGITKRVNPHVFRHSKVTRMLEKGVHESVLKKTIWGSVSSNMLKNYEHISNDEIDNEILRANGLSTTPKKHSILCPVCMTINAEEATTCRACHANMIAVAAGESEIELLKKSNDELKKALILQGIQFKEMQQVLKILTDKDTK